MAVFRETGFKVLSSKLEISFSKLGKILQHVKKGLQCLIIRKFQTNMIFWLREFRECTNLKNKSCWREKLVIFEIPTWPIKICCYAYWTMFRSIAGDLEGNLKDKLTLLSTDMRDPCCDKFVLTAMPQSQTDVHRNQNWPPGTNFSGAALFVKH